MFPQRHPSGTGLTYGLNYPTPNQDHLVRGFECTKRVHVEIHLVFMRPW